jgi:hypothetical protein
MKPETYGILFSILGFGIYFGLGIFCIVRLIKNTIKFKSFNKAWNGE